MKLLKDDAQREVLEYLEQTPDHPHKNYIINLVKPQRRKKVKEDLTSPETVV
jgi:hypothetical protein